MQSLDFFKKQETMDLFKIFQSVLIFFLNYIAAAQAVNGANNIKAQEQASAVAAAQASAAASAAQVQYF